MYKRKLIQLAACSVSLLITAIPLLHGQQLEMFHPEGAGRSIILSPEDIALLKHSLRPQEPNTMELQLLEDCSGYSYKTATIVLPRESKSLDADSFGFHVKSVSAAASNVSFVAELEQTALLSCLNVQHTLLLIDNAPANCALAEPASMVLPEPNYIDLREPPEHKFRQGAQGPAITSMIDYDHLLSMDIDFIMQVDEQGFITVIIIEVDSSGHYQKRVINTGVSKFSQKGRKLIKKAEQSVNVVLLDEEKLFAVFLDEWRQLNYGFVDLETLDDENLELRAKEGILSPESILLIDTDQVLELPKSSIHQLPKQQPGKEKEDDAKKGDDKKGDDKKDKLSAKTRELRKKDFSQTISRRELEGLLSSAHFDGVDIKVNWRRHVYELEISGQYDRAAQYMETILSFYPGNKTVLHALIWHYIKRGLITEARNRIEQWRGANRGSDDKFLMDMLSNESIASIQATSYDRFCYRYPK